MVITLPEHTRSTKLTLDPEDILSDDAYFAFCQANPDLRVERTAKGEITMTPPAGFESSYRNSSVTSQLYAWATRDRKGRSCDSSAEFILPDGSALSPDAAWVSRARLDTLSKEDKRKFLKLAPEFVIEIMSPSDRLPARRRKMESWITNGVHLGWLIDGDSRTVHIFRIRKQPEQVSNVLELAADGPVTGFVLQLEDVWAGL